MTPQEIQDHKMKWRPGFAIPYHSDLKYEAREWVKANVQKQSYHHHNYTDVYEHTYEFEHPGDAHDFKALFGSER